ncbi:hypothetical protein AAFF_G00376200 [Aldrovandia affinis]|uniref:Uncharacterized protein n=1 Tax=Aldrovandia affinis TaxID=143900 RepID=A0AAD7SFK1_9TELE|nr:hypothetical protein AAFF_G00376200 [Aldrovandia affinis]
MWELVVYLLLPLVLLLLPAPLFLGAPLRPRVGRWGGRVARWLWAWVCWCLELPSVPEDAAGGERTAGSGGQRAERGQRALSWGAVRQGPPAGAGRGVVALDWAVGLEGEQQRGAKREQPAGGKVLGCHSSCPPVLILVPNSWGRVTPHLLRLCALALRQGYYPVVFHRRGQGGCPLVTPRFQEFGDPSDLVQAVAYLRHRHPSSALLAVSEGSGSGLLLSYLGECGSSSYLTAAACLSPVLRGRLWFETPLPPLYRWGYAGALGAVMDVERLLRCSSQRDLEAAMFCPEEGAGAGPKADWDSYWERNEPLRDADEVAVPVLCLRSRDDPLLPPASSLPVPLFRDNPYFLLALTAHGGHCGFASRGEPVDGDGATCWSHGAVLEYFRTVAEFLRAEERGAKGATGSGGSPGSRRRTNSMMSRRRRATGLRRERPAAQTPLRFAIGWEEQEAFTWHRSYTR